MPKLTDEFPAIVPAHDFLMPSYQWLVSRVESADTRLTNLLTIIYTLTLGTPVFARAVRPNIELAHPLFIVAMILFLLAGFVAIVGRVRTGLALSDPGFLWANASSKTSTSSSRTRSTSRVPIPVHSRPYLFLMPPPARGLHRPFLPSIWNMSSRNVHVLQCVQWSH